MASHWTAYLCLFAAALVTTLATTPLARRIAVAVDAVDYPNKRRINRKPIPRMGGIAIFCGIVAAFVVQYLGTTYLCWPAVLVPSPKLQVDYWLLVLAFLVIFFTGLLDDRYSLKPLQKLAGQVLAATLAVAGGLVIGDISNPFAPGFLSLGWLAYPITVLYLVAYTNIINLIDGLDGLAAGISAIAGATMFVHSVLAARLDAAVLAVAVVGASLGFLRYNFHPASIFMGDSGSLVLGLALGVVSLFAIARSTLFISLLVPILAAGVPVTDTAVAIIRRKRAHQRVDQPDTGHIHHRLLRAGFSQNATVGIMWAWTAALSVCSIVLAESDGFARVTAIIMAAAITGFAIGKLHLLEPVLRHHYSPRHTKAKKKDPDR